MESNGRISADDKYMHVHIIYFFIKSILKRDNI